MSTHNRFSKSSHLDSKIAELDKLLDERRKLASQLAAERQGLEKALATTAAGHPSDVTGDEPLSEDDGDHGRFDRLEESEPEELANIKTNIRDIVRNRKWDPDFGTGASTTQDLGIVTERDTAPEGADFEADTLKSVDKDKHPVSTDTSADLDTVVAELDLTTLSLDDGPIQITEEDQAAKKKARRKRSKPKKKKGKSQDSKDTQETVENGSPDWLTLTANHLTEKANSYATHISDLDERLRLSSLTAEESKEGGSAVIDASLVQEITNLGDQKREVTRSLAEMLSKIDLNSLSPEAQTKLVAELANLAQALNLGGSEPETAEGVSAPSSAGQSGFPNSGKGKAARK